MYWFLQCRKRPACQACGMSRTCPSTIVYSRLRQYWSTGPLLPSPRFAPSIQCDHLLSFHSGNSSLSSAGSHTRYRQPGTSASSSTTRVARSDPPTFTIVTSCFRPRDSASLLGSSLTSDRMATKTFWLSARISAPTCSLPGSTITPSCSHGPCLTPQVYRKTSLQGVSPAISQQGERSTVSGSGSSAKQPSLFEKSWTQDQQFLARWILMSLARLFISSKEVLLTQPKSRLSEDSMTGCEFTCRQNLQLRQSRTLNCPDTETTVQFLQFRTNTEDSAGPMKMRQSSHSSTQLFAILSKIKSLQPVHLSRLNCCMFTSPTRFTLVSFTRPSNLQSARFIRFLFVNEYSFFFLGSYGTGSCTGSGTGTCSGCGTTQGRGATQGWGARYGCGSGIIGEDKGRNYGCYRESSLGLNQSGLNSEGGLSSIFFCWVEWPTTCSEIGGGWKGVTWLRGLTTALCYRALCSSRMEIGCSLLSDELISSPIIQQVIVGLADCVVRLLLRQSHRHIK